MGALIKHAAERAKVDPAEVEDVILGCAAPEGTTGSNFARRLGDARRRPVSVSGATVNRFCSSGLQTIAMAAQRVLVDKVPVMIAGGLESVSLVQGPPAATSTASQRGCRSTSPASTTPMITPPTVVAERYKISREAQDDYSLESQLRTAAAQQAGKFDDEIVPMETEMLVDRQEHRRDAQEEVTLTKDEGNRPDTDLEGLAKLQPVAVPTSDHRRQCEPALRRRLGLR